MDYINNIVSFVSAHYFDILILILIIAGVFIKMKNLICNNLVEWLVMRVGDAEIYLGSKTGQMKLREVYNAFVSGRPVLSIFISFDKFRELVDVALEKFESMLSDNGVIKEWYDKKKEEMNK